jgi:hypothetical protein
VMLEEVVRFQIPFGKTAVGGEVFFQWEEEVLASILCQVPTSSTLSTRDGGYFVMRK